VRIIKPSFEILSKINREEILKSIELAGRTCYKSENKITEDSASKFVKKIIENGHETVIEHCSISVRFICDRGVSHELVRHRLVSFSQESTRYCNYGKDDHLTFIKPCFFQNIPIGEFNSLPDIVLDDIWKSQLDWCALMMDSELGYKNMIKAGCTPQEARSVLPNSLKTEIVVTANLREWRHIFKLRAINKKAHPQIREIMLPLLIKLIKILPEIFYDLYT
jgi:thymidylate synthase (FAD)